MRFILVMTLTVFGLSLATATAQAKIEIGVCKGSEYLQAAKDAGFAYIELSTQGLAQMSDEQFAAFQKERTRIGLATPVSNLFVPSDIKLTGPNTDAKQQAAYVDKALSRAAQVGIKIVVFGSGGARLVPEGFSHKEAFSQLVTFGRMAARQAKKHGITIAVEPLRSQESNIINTAAEGLRLVKAIKHPNFQLMVDMYHLASENESPDIIVKARKHIRHFHIANPEGRRYPNAANKYDYAPFFAALHKIKYSGGISVEGKAEDFAAESPATIEMLSRLAQPKKTDPLKR